MLNLLRTADKLQFRLGRFFRSFGLTQSQYNVLRILRGQGSPLPSLEIANRMVTAVPAITALIDRLESAGLVKRDRSAQDRRVVYVSITDKALNKLAEIDQPLAELHRKLLGHMKPPELQQLSHLLERARQPLEE